MVLALGVAKMSLDKLLEADLSREGDSSAREARRLVEHAIKTRRTLTFELASAVLYEVGFGAGLHCLCATAERESGIRFKPPSEWEDQPIPKETRIVLYRACREWIRNIVKHSKAREAR
jgi:signal transduction histidine kinase